MKNVKIFEELNSRGTKGFVLWLESLSEEDLYQLQRKYFSRPIKKNKEKQIDKIIKDTESFINIGWCFSDRKKIVIR